MSALAFTVLGAQPAAYTAAPGIAVRMRIDNDDDARVHAMALRCQTRIEARRRPYTADEQSRLYELFGDASQWDRTLQAINWGQTSVLVPSFERSTEIEFTLACTYDLEVASSKYLHGVRTGEIPLVFLFSGSIFMMRAGVLSVEPVPWDLQATYRMPAATWEAAMNQFFPGGGWLRLQRETLDRLQAFRGKHAVTTWDEAIDVLLHAAASAGTV